MEKKNIGNLLALYPKPMTVVGAEVEGKVNWLVVGHTGIIGHDRILVSMSKSHHTNQGIKDSKKLSINLVSREMLPKADYVGSVSGASVNKSNVFEYHWGENGTPVIDASPLTMYAVSEKENPCKVTILETYATREAYEKHIASEHFQKYKQGTLHMVKSLVLADQTPLNLANKINNFIQ